MIDCPKGVYRKTINFQLVQHVIWNIFNNLR
jgi:hypothetical protein